MADRSAARIARKLPPIHTGRNAAIVRRAYQALNRGEIATLRPLFHPRASWHTPGHSQLAGNRQGCDAVCSQLRRYGEETGGTFRADLLTVLESHDGRVVSVHYYSAERRGRRLDDLCCIVFELQADRIVIGREHFYDLYAWDLFWS